MSLVAVGYFGLWGPFKFLNDMRMSNIPGNAKEAVSGTTLADLNGTSYLSRLKNVDKTKQFDTQTVIGSMEAIICYCQETWNCPVIFYTGTKYVRIFNRRNAWWITIRCRNCD